MAYEGEDEIVTTVTNPYITDIANSSFATSNFIDTLITFPTFSKNRWNDNNANRSRNNMTQNNYKYSNNQIDSKTRSEFYLVAYNNNTAISTIGTLYVT